ncbi:hypothetical protein BDV26DRAFT_254678 [Aspergillus bertholletiae]|uniref:Uncharacterized protein n=1 Tax=Aspergillus bertholletiae TaxID=1226010 RepID=A0A5N7BJQ3_9EURO|nr:hypothetical protein BDV26DRAFT_254678 [Aspergillus bertholletiae]
MWFLAMCIVCVVAHRFNLKKMPRPSRVGGRELRFTVMLGYILAVRDGPKAVTVDKRVRAEGPFNLTSTCTGWMWCPGPHNDPGCGFFYPQT